MVSAGLEQVSQGCRLHKARGATHRAVHPAPDESQTFFRHQPLPLCVRRPCSKRRPLGPATPAYRDLFQQPAQTDSVRPLCTRSRQRAVLPTQHHARPRRLQVLLPHKQTPPSFHAARQRLLPPAAEHAGSDVARLDKGHVPLLPTQPATREAALLPAACNLSKQPSTPNWAPPRAPCLLHSPHHNPRTQRLNPPPARPLCQFELHPRLLLLALHLSGFARAMQKRRQHAILAGGQQPLRSPGHLAAIAPLARGPHSPLVGDDAQKAAAPAR